MRLVPLAAATFVAVLALPTLACEGHAPGEEPAQHVLTNMSGWTSGEVIEVDLDDGTLVLRHGRVAAWNMAAMESMVFKARDPQQIARLKARDKVSFRAGMVGQQPTIRDIKLATK